MRRMLLLPAICLLLQAPLSMAQAGDAAPSAKFNSSAQVVLVPTTVMNRKGEIVGGLSQDAFLVSQDNAPQRIISFGEEDVPVSLGVVLDTSGSMQNVLGEAKNTLRTFFSISNPEDEAFLFTFSTRPDRDSGFTGNFESLLAQPMFAQAGGSTALIDTIYAALQEIRHAHHPRRAILVISDGMDNHSRYSAHELMEAAVEADLQIYSISVYDPPRNKKPIELEEERDGLAFLEELTRRTGGVQVVVRGRDEVDQAADRMARAIRNQYLIGYVPDRVNNSGKWHSIKVTVKASDAKAYARSGFYAR